MHADGGEMLKIAGREIKGAGVGGEARGAWGGQGGGWGQFFIWSLECGHLSVCGSRPHQPSVYHSFSLGVTRDQICHFISPSLSLAFAGVLFIIMIAQGEREKGDVIFLGAFHIQFTSTISLSLSLFFACFWGLGTWLLLLPFQLHSLIHTSERERRGASE